MDPYALDPSMDFDAQEQQLLQQAARIKALRGFQASAGPEQPQGFRSAVTGAGVMAPMVKKSLLGQLSPLIADYSADRGEEASTANRSQLTRAEQAALADWIGKTPQSKTEQVPLAPGTPTGAFTGSETDIISAINNIADPTERARALQGYQNQQAGNMRTVTTPPERADVLAHAQAGYSNPLSKTLAQQYLADQLVKEPEREEARAARLHEKQMALAAARQKAIDDAALKREEGTANRQNKLDVAEIMAGSKAPNNGTWVVSPNPDANGQPFMYNNKDPRQTMPIGAKPPPAAKPPKELTPKQQEAQDALLVGSRTYTNAFNTYKDDYSGGFGTAKLKSTLGGYTPIGEETNQYWTPVKKQQAIANHQLYGASFTGAEQQRADAYNPTEYKSREQNLAGMGQMAIDQGLAQVRTNYLHNYPGSYVDNDGSVVLKDGRVISDTRSRVITNGEIKSQKLKPMPTYREIEARTSGEAPQPGRNTGGATGGWDPANPPTIVRSKEERDALPSGTKYIDAQGNVATKK